MSEKMRARVSTPPTRAVVTVFVSALAVALAVVVYGYGQIPFLPAQIHPLYTTAQVTATTHPGLLQALQRCDSNRIKPGPVSSDLQDRTVGHADSLDVPSMLITNATIFTGAKSGNYTYRGDILLQKGVVRGIGTDIPHGKNTTVINARGAWVTPGLDSNELDSNKGPILPYLRSIDGFHTFDERIQRAITHGVTSAQVVSGKANLVGGQSFVVKLRKTSKGSPSSMVINEENGWKYLIQSCNEATRKYGNRPDAIWELRNAYHEAKKVLQLQDSFCAKAEAGLLDSEVYPESLQYEAAVNTLRGKVKVFNVCGEVVDLDNMIQLAEEFDFGISAFLLASEAWLVPGLMKKVIEGGTAIALPGNNYGYSRETYRGSPFAPRVLAGHKFNASVIMMSDETSGGGYIIDEARKAYYFGLTERDALNSITSTAASALGLSHRIGVLKKGSDADVVLWDSHPLQPGANPIQTWIDGIPQGRSPDLNATIPRYMREPKWQKVPLQPNFDKERERAFHMEGVEPFNARNLTGGKVAFKNVTQVWDRKGDGDIEKIYPVGRGPPEPGLVVVEEGVMTCVGEVDLCSTAAHDADHTMDLHGGSISPGLMSFGSRLGLEEFVNEPSTGDGALYNAFAYDVPNALQDAGGMVRAIDGLMFGTRHALTAYRMGVTSATSSLMRPRDIHRSRASDSIVIWGLSTTFRTSAMHAFEPGTIMQDVAALHVRISRPTPAGQGIRRSVSVSEQIAGLRRLLHGWESRDSDTGVWFKRAAEGVIPLVIDVHSADIMTSLIAMKAEVDDRIGGQMRMVFSGASEAHVLAKELHRARIGVILTRLRPTYTEWDGRKILPGPPLSNETTLGVLLEHKVSVAIGVEHPQLAANALFDLRQAVSELRGKVKEHAAYSLTTRNLEELLGVKGMGEEKADLVAFDQGSVLDAGSKAVAVIVTSRGVVDVL
ncbi:hypothetical protein V5O48_007988 [Marasmius crinis-equi]|uniref:Amidohydrolase-related domain-containing protein n=1 Tax=Marasmius crinis-equi TaxID=585013 RepID=A0ABR3FFA2_9AGAR